MANKKHGMVSVFGAILKEAFEHNKNRIFAYPLQKVVDLGTTIFL